MSSQNQHQARGPAAAAAAAIASAAAIAAPQAAYCELCDVSGCDFFVPENREKARQRAEGKGWGKKRRDERRRALVFFPFFLSFLFFLSLAQTKNTEKTKTKTKTPCKQTGILPRRGRLEPAPLRSRAPPSGGEEEGRGGEVVDVGGGEGRGRRGGVGQRGVVRWRRRRRWRWWWQHQQ